MFPLQEGDPLCHDWYHQTVALQFNTSFVDMYWTDMVQDRRCVLRTLQVNTGSGNLDVKRLSVLGQFLRLFGVRTRAHQPAKGQWLCFVRKLCPVERKCTGAVGAGGVVSHLLRGVLFPGIGEQKRSPDSESLAVCFIMEPERPAVAATAAVQLWDELRLWLTSLGTRGTKSRCFPHQLIALFLLKVAPMLERCWSDVALRFLPSLPLIFCDVVYIVLENSSELLLVAKLTAMVS